MSRIWICLKVGILLFIIIIISGWLLTLRFVNVTCTRFVKVKHQIYTFVICKLKNKKCYIFTLTNVTSLRFGLFVIYGVAIKAIFIVVYCYLLKIGNGCYICWRTGLKCTNTVWKDVRISLFKTLAWYLQSAVVSTS